MKNDTNSLFLYHHVHHIPINEIFMENHTQTANLPTISIVIATRNAAKPLHTTLSCIPAQSPFSYEIVIQDGLSEDETCAVAQKFCHLPISLKSERDCGIYDAWNKALVRVRGQWVLFIGAGDSLDWAALLICVSELKQQPEHIEYYSTPVQRIAPQGEKLEKLLASANPMQDLPYELSLPHPGLFHRNTLFKANNFDISYRIAGDYDFVCRTLRAENFCVGETGFVSMLTGGISCSMGTMCAALREQLCISKKYFPNAFPLKAYLLLVRGWCCQVLCKLCGVRIAGYFADIPRLVQGKPRYWSRPELQGNNNAD